MDLYPDETHSSRSSFGPLNSFALGPLLAMRGVLAAIVSPPGLLCFEGPSSSSSDEELLKIEYLTLHRKGAMHCDTKPEQVMQGFYLAQERTRIEEKRADRIEKRE